jgi:hypothetical protein
MMGLTYSFLIQLDGLGAVHTLLKVCDHHYWKSQEEFQLSSLTSRMLFLVYMCEQTLWDFTLPTALLFLLH